MTEGQGDIKQKYSQIDEEPKVGVNLKRATMIEQAPVKKVEFEAVATATEIFKIAKEAYYPKLQELDDLPTDKLIRKCYGYIATSLHMFEVEPNRPPKVFRNNSMPGVWKAFISEVPQKEDLLSIITIDWINNDSEKMQFTTLRFEITSNGKANYTYDVEKILPDGNLGKKLLNEQVNFDSVGSYLEENLLRQKTKLVTDITQTLASGPYAELPVIVGKPKPVPILQRIKHGIKSALNF